MDKPKRPTLRKISYDNLSDAARQELRKATIDAMIEGAKGG